MISRRNLISGLTAFIAAPAIIRVAGIMPIRAFENNPFITETYFVSQDAWIWAPINIPEFWPDVSDIDHSLEAALALS